MNVEFFTRHQDIPAAVLYADDDAVWWEYYNRTLGIPISKSDWETNNRPFLDDDNVVSFPVAGDKEIEVTQFQLVALAAAVCYWVTGVLHVCLQHGKWIKATYGVMVLAASLGIASAMLLEYDGYWASVLYATSVHLFAAQAIALVVLRSSFDEDENVDESVVNDAEKDEKAQDKKPIKDVSQHSDTVGSSNGKIIWSLVGDICFLIGSLIGVFLSYFRIHESAGISHAYAGVAATAFWLVAAFLYFSIAARGYCSSKGIEGSSDDSSISSQESNDKNKTALEFGDSDSDDGEDSKTSKAWLLKGTPLADKMDGENSIVSGSSTPSDEASSLEL